MGGSLNDYQMDVQSELRLSNVRIALQFLEIFQSSAVVIMSLYFIQSDSDRMGSSSAITPTELVSAKPLPIS